MTILNLIYKNKKKNKKIAIFNNENYIFDNLNSRKASLTIFNALTQKLKIVIKLPNLVGYERAGIIGFINKDEEDFDDGIMDLKSRIKLTKRNYYE